MIDRPARDEARRLLDRVREGALTNWQLEDAWPKSDVDPAINCILRWLWTQCDDDEASEVLACLGEEDAKVLDRCIQFLATDLEFPLRALTPDEESAERRKWGVEWLPGCTSPEDNYWPFPRQW
jgi:hypothetical protein